MKEPVLLTPGPLTTSTATKLAMARDWGSRDTDFIELNRRVREMLLDVIHGKETHVCVPLQGSGTFAVEAMHPPPRVECIVSRLWSTKGREL